MLQILLAQASLRVTFISRDGLSDSKLIDHDVSDKPPYVVLLRKQRRRRVNVGRDRRGWRQRERGNGGERIDSHEQQQQQQQQSRLQGSEAAPGGRRARRLAGF